MKKPFFGRLKAIIIISIALLLLGTILVLRYFPYQTLAEQRIIKFLEANNIKVSSLAIESADSSEIIFSNIKLDGDSGFSLKHLKVQYDLSKLITGKITTLEAENAEVTLYKKNKKLTVGGLEEFLSHKSEPSNDRKINIPTDKAAFENIAPDKVSLTNLNLSVKDENLEILLPVDLTFALDPAPTLNMNSSGVNIDAEAYHLTTSNISLKAALNDNKWSGQIIIPSVKITGAEAELPILSMKIDFVLDEENMNAHIMANDDKKLTMADIDLSVPVANPASGKVNIKKIQFPWGGGLISSGGVKIDLAMDKPVFINVKLLNVALEDTLGKVSDGKVNGTGKISGTFPVIYNPDGTIILKEGGAEDVSVGTISVSPDLLPGDNEQLALARNTLENFHYTKLKILVSSNDNKSAINLMVEGKNPESMEGRSFKFNINLTGDILPLIQQSIIPFNDIKELLKRGK